MSLVSCFFRSFNRAAPRFRQVKPKSYSNTPLMLFPASAVKIQSSLENIVLIIEQYKFLT